MAETATIGKEELHLLRNAFRSFDHAAGTLQESYQALTARVAHLDVELAATTTHLEAILESLTTGVIVADQDGTIIRCNNATGTLLGVRRRELLGRDLARMLRDMNLDGRQYPCLSPTGTILSVSRTALRNGERLKGHIVLIQDMSAIRRLEERLQRRDRLAAMGEMVGRIAHEIRNPLGSVELFASMLRKDAGGEPSQRRYAEHILSATQAMDRLLSNLLTYTKPDCSRADRHAIEPLLREALALASHKIQRPGIRVALTIDRVPTIWCHAAQMKQVVLNLCLNAADAMPEGGTLSIAVSKEEDRAARTRWVRIAISDTGTGIDPAHLSRIFDPFFTTRDEGTGLGLAIVHAIVEGHHGRVEVDSTRGQGTTFTIVLPDKC